MLSVDGLGTFTFPGLPPGGSASRAWTRCPATRFAATVDSTGQVEESNERKNVAAFAGPCA